jgi:hypothetical protein
MISASLLKQFVRSKLSHSTVTIEERGAVLEQVFGLIFNEAVPADVKDVLSDSIKVILIKAESILSAH